MFRGLTMTEARTISARALEEKTREGHTVELIDVRTAVEFREVHAEAARNDPLDTLDPNDILEGRNGTSKEPLYLICRTGSRAKQAATKFEKAGIENIILVEGGTEAWVAEGLPVVRGKKAVSLERQVRIAAGSLVLLGSLLTYFANPYFILLPAFVGAGLIFAGVTDTCGMGMLLSKMPWNRVKKERGACRS